MNYTTNYHLPQWVAEDRILMEDFNQMCTDIDGGIAAAKTAADTAESKADAAQDTAEAAQNSANALADAYTPSNKPYVVGSYRGDGAGTQAITLGFCPSLVIISGEPYTTDQTGGMPYTVVATGSAPGLVIYMTETGFTVHVIGDYTPYLNEHNRNYRYIAFR